VKIRTVTIPAKRVFVRGKVGHKSGYKKAYIYLKKGEKVEII
jgi:ribosomal protein L23